MWKREPLPRRRSYRQAQPTSPSLSPPPSLSPSVSLSLVYWQNKSIAMGKQHYENAEQWIHRERSHMDAQPLRYQNLA